MNCTVPPDFFDGTILRWKSNLPQRTTIHLGDFPLAVAREGRGLFDGQLLQQGINVVALGSPGTGKTRVATAAGHTLIDQLHSIRFVQAHDLIRGMASYFREGVVMDPLRRADTVETLVLDDLRRMPEDKYERDALTALLESGRTRRSVFITTTTDPGEWHDYAAVTDIGPRTVFIDFNGAGRVTLTSPLQPSS